MPTTVAADLLTAYAAIVGITLMAHTALRWLDARVRAVLRREGG